MDSKYRGQFSENSKFFLVRTKKKQHSFFKHKSYFYRLPISLQWFFAIGLFLFGFYTVSWLDSWPKLLFIFPILAILQYGCTPLFKLIGFYQYLSPTVFVMFPTEYKYELHNAATFDYLQQFSWSDRGKRAERQLLNNYGTAFLTIIEQIEQKQVPDSVEIIGHSYFFSDRTTRKLGFQVTKADKITTFCSCLNALELMVLYSFSKGRWAIPKFWDVKSISISGKDLCQKKELIKLLVQKINKND